MPPVTPLADDILSQPAVWETLIRERLPVGFQGGGNFTTTPAPPRWGLVGEGSSYFAARLMAQAWGALWQLSAQAQTVSGWREGLRQGLLLPAGWVWVSQSGKTGSLLRLLAQLPPEVFQPHVPHWVVTNTPQSALHQALTARGASCQEVAMAMPPEQAIAATKTVTGSLYAMTALGAMLAGESWQSEPLMVDRAWFPLLTDRLHQIVQPVLSAYYKHCVLLGDTWQEVALQEVGLKWIETARLWVHINTPETFKHGFKALTAVSNTLAIGWVPVTPERRSPYLDDLAQLLEKTSSHLTTLVVCFTQESLVQARATLPPETLCVCLDLPLSPALTGTRHDVLEMLWLVVAGQWMAEFWRDVKGFPPEGLPELDKVVS
jgi:fructoselysine-6-P-deglycase FrlB-like protein